MLDVRSLTALRLALFPPRPASAGASLKSGRRLPIAEHARDVANAVRKHAGKTVLNDVLAALRPRLHLFGHHHEFTDSIRNGVRSIGLDVVTSSYLLVDAETLSAAINTLGQAGHTIHRSAAE